MLARLGYRYKDRDKPIPLSGHLEFIRVKGQIPYTGEIIGSAEGCDTSVFWGGGLFCFGGFFL